VTRVKGRIKGSPKGWRERVQEGGFAKAADPEKQRERGKASCNLKEGLNTESLFKTWGRFRFGEITF